MRKILPIIVSVVVALGLIGGALAWRSYTSATPTPFTESRQAPNKKFTANELAAFNGRSGNECYVAVDGTVYKIKMGLLWKDGKHLPSLGKAECGKDLSEVMKESPHGKSKLHTLEIMGTYTSD